MLQQTQAARVIPYYERVPRPLPGRRDARQRATARRPRSLERPRLQPPRAPLHAAARVVAASGWPDDLTELPGVGPYTAAAVGSFAWDRPQAAIDTNARRVIERFDGVSRTPAALARRAAELLPADRAADFNQAMMELGATVCRPRAPRCGDVPGPRRLRDPRGRRAGAAATPPRRRAVRGQRPLGARAHRRRPAFRRAAARRADRRPPRPRAGRARARRARRAPPRRLGRTSGALMCSAAVTA